MLGIIKSLKITKEILLSYIERKHLLKLINYNKSLQSKLSISLDIYKDNAIVYRIIENDGKGKEYHKKTNELLFEGEYKNKKRNGMGKEYKEGKLIFKGEYKNGIKNGYGKKYDNKDGKLIFEGQYLNGAEWEGKEMVEELFKNLNITSVIIMVNLKKVK